MAEGFILIVCASLPTLGPLFRAARGKLTESGGTGQHSRNQLEGSHGISAGASRNWDTFKGHKLDSDIGEQSSLHLRPSFDAIPLVTTNKTNGFAEEGTDRRGIHKTIEVSVVSSQCLDEKRQQGVSAL